MAASRPQVNGVTGSDDDVPLNVVVQLSNQDDGDEQTYFWEVVDEPPGTADALSNATIENPTFTPKKEGTYLLRLTVDLGLGSEDISTIVVGVRHLRTNERLPAAAEVTEDGARGWAAAENAAVLRGLNAASDSNIIACKNGTLGSLTAGTIVHFVGDGLIKTGLPGEERLLTASVATAATRSGSRGTMGVVVGAADGGTWSTSKVGLVRVFGLVETAVAGSPTVDDPVYLSNAGLPSLAPGTYSRVVGRVVEVSGGNYRWVVEGLIGASRKETRYLHPGGSFYGGSMSWAGGGHLQTTGAGSTRFGGFVLGKGDKISGMTFELYGDGAADVTSFTAYAYTAGGTSVLGTLAVANQPAAWSTKDVTPFTETEIAADTSVFVEVVYSAAALRFGTIGYTVEPALGA